MDALVLVGGEGTRLRPLTYDIPKPMLPIVGRPMIARIVEWLARFGVRRVVLSLGYRPDAFLEGFPEGRWAGVELMYAVEPEPLDTAGAIRFAAESSGIGDQSFFVVNGDVLTDLDLLLLLARHAERKAEATIALTPVEDPSAYGVVPTDDTGRVLAFIEKPNPGEAPTNFINAGTYVVEPRLLERIPRGRRVSIEREIFPRLVADGSLYALGSDVYWIDTGTPEHYLEAQLDVLGGRRRGVELPEHEEFGPGVAGGPGSRFAGNSEGAVFLCRGAVVDKDAVVADSVVGEDALVSSGSVLRRSVLLRGARLLPGAQVSDSIVGPGATIGEGAVVTSQSIIGASAVVVRGSCLDSARVPV